MVIQRLKVISSTHDTRRLWAAARYDSSHSADRMVLTLLDNDTITDADII